MGDYFLIFSLFVWVVKQAYSDTVRTYVDEKSEPDFSSSDLKYKPEIMLEFNLETIQFAIFCKSTTQTGFTTIP